MRSAASGEKGETSDVAVPARTSAAQVAALPAHDVRHADDEATGGGEGDNSFHNGSTGAGKCSRTSDRMMRSRTAPRARQPRPRPPAGRVPRTPRAPGFERLDAVDVRAALAHQRERNRRAAPNLENAQTRHRSARSTCRSLVNRSAGEPVPSTSRKYASDRRGPNRSHPARAQWFRSGSRRPMRRMHAPGSIRRSTPRSMRDCRPRPETPGTVRRSSVLPLRHQRILAHGSTSSLQSVRGAIRSL